eukprot:Lankesteria_metandrocarpae@DN5197_c1_g1_i2.p1
MRNALMFLGVLAVLRMDCRATESVPLPKQKVDINSLYDKVLLRVKDRIGKQMTILKAELDNNVERLKHGKERCAISEANEQQCLEQSETVKKQDEAYNFLVEHCVEYYSSRWKFSNGAASVFLSPEGAAELAKKLKAFDISFKKMKVKTYTSGLDASWQAAQTVCARDFMVVKGDEMDGIRRYVKMASLENEGKC